MQMMMRAGREIAYWQEAYERAVSEDQWMGSFRESSYYAQSAVGPWSESPDIASRPPRPRSNRQPRTGPSGSYRQDRDAESGGSAS